MRRLSGLDSLFLSLETPTNLFHVGALAILDPSSGPGRAELVHEVIRQVLEERIHLLGPFRRRLHTAPGGIDHPVWLEDPDYKIENHLRRAAIPQPGGQAELAAYAAEVLGRPLDRDRPLWEMHLVEGVQDGLVAAVAKIHHCAIDGLSGVELTCNLMDLTPEIRPVDPPADPWQADELPLRAPMAVQSALRLASRTRALPGLAAGVASTALRVRANNRASPDGVPPTPFRAPATSLNKRLGRRRAIGFASLDRSDIDDLKAATGVSFNDVILTVTGTALREHLADRGEVPSAPLVAFVPVAAGGATTADRLDQSVNQLSGMLVSLATTTDDLAYRLRAVARSAAAAKSQDRLIGPSTMSSLAELAVPAFMRPASRLYGMANARLTRPMFNVTVSSFPGSDVPLYCGGSRLIAYYPFGPIVDGGSLNVTAMTYQDHVGVGILADAEALEDAEALAGRFPEALAATVKAVAAG
jgi:diacylglycerol O-acyltransferase